MKKFLSSLAVVVALSGCGQQGGQQGSSESATQNNNTPAAKTVVRNFDISISNADPTSIGRCGDKFVLQVSKLGSADPKIAYSSAVVTVAGREVATLASGDSLYTLETSNLPCGRIPVSVKVVADGLDDEYISRSLLLYSDVVPQNKGYKVLKTFNHDKGAYTQGLLVEGNCFYESTGLQRKSSLRKVGIDRGDVQMSVPLEDEYFGEGLAVVGNRLIQLTWRNHKGFVYDKASFARLQEFYVSTEGWGLSAISPDTLVLTDGTENLYFMEPGGFAVVGSVQVYDNLGPVVYLNETELYHGHLLANIYQTNTIAEIDYRTGKVLSYIDLTGILPDNLRDSDTDVLNGIAYDEANDALYVTGKNWPKLYQIKIQ